MYQKIINISAGQYCKIANCIPSIKSITVLLKFNITVLM